MAQTRKSKPKAKRVEDSPQVKAVEPKGGAAQTAEEAAPPARPQAEAAAAAEDPGKAAQTAGEAGAAEVSGEAVQTAEEAAPPARPQAGATAAAEDSGEAAQTAGEAGPAEVSGEAAQDEARQRVAELEAELVQAKDRFLRALAETENVRRRARRDLEDASKYAIAVFAKSLLAVADNLRRALDSISETGGEKPAEAGEKPAGAGEKPAGAGEENELLKQLAEGVEIVERELLTAFEKHGICKIEPLGEKFDHGFHQAMFEMEDADKPAGTIVQILEPGYLIHDRLLRPAMVAVAKDKSKDKSEDTAKDKSEDTAKGKSEDTAKGKSEDDEGKSDGDEDKSDEGAQSGQVDAPAEKSI